MSRGDLSIGFLVTSAALLAFLVVSLVIVWPVLKDALFGAGEEGQCQFSLLLSSKLKGFTFGAADLPPECKTRRMTIGFRELDNEQLAAQKELRQAIKENPSLIVEGYTDDERGYRRWELARTFSDRLVDCFNRGWRGQIDLQGASFLNLLTTETGAQVCVLCARMTLEPEVRQYFAGDTVNLQAYLKATVTREKSPVYSFLTTGVADPIFVFTVDNSFANANERSAVLFVGGITKAVGATTKAAGGVGVFPYDAITTNLGYSYVKGVWKLSKEAPAKCAVIIGD